MAGLPAHRIEAQKKFASDAIASITGDFDPDTNPTHAAAAARLRGAIRASSVIDVDYGVGTEREGEDPDGATPAMAIRVDGTVDLVNNTGQQQIDAGGVPEAHDILRSFAPDLPVRRTIGVQSYEAATRIQVHVDPTRHS